MLTLHIIIWETISYEKRVLVVIKKNLFKEISILLKKKSLIEKKKNSQNNLIYFKDSFCSLYNFMSYYQYENRKIVQGTKWAL